MAIKDKEFKTSLSQRRSNKRFIKQGKTSKTKIGIKKGQKFSKRINFKISSMITLMLVLSKR